MADETCSCCGDSHPPIPEEQHVPTAPIQCVIVWSPGLKDSKAANMTPAGGYTFCSACKGSAFVFVKKCIEASPWLRQVATDRWTRAIIITEAGEGFSLKPVRKELAQA